MSLHQIRKVLFLLRPADATNGEFKLLSYLAWDARHDGRRVWTTIRRLTERSGLTYDTVRHALVEFEARGWLTLRRGPRGRIVDWRLTLPKKLERGLACGKPCGKAVHKLWVSPRDLSVRDPVNGFEGSGVPDPTNRNSTVSDGAVTGSPYDPSLSSSFDPLVQREEAPLRGAPLAEKVHSENAVSNPPDPDTLRARQHLRQLKATLDATPATTTRRRRR